LISVRTIV